MTDAKDKEIQHLRSWLHRVLYETGCTRGQHTTQWCEEARAVKDELAAARAEIEQCILNMATISTIACKQDLDWYPTEQPWERPALRDVVRLVSTLKEARAEIERLKSRVGWLDHLDTEEGRKLHANEALLVEVERLKAELAKAKEAT